MTFTGPVYGLVSIISGDASISVNWGKNPFVFNNKQKLEVELQNNHTSVPLRYFSEAKNALCNSSGQFIPAMLAVGKIVTGSVDKQVELNWKRICTALSATSVATPVSDKKEQLREDLLRMFGQQPPSPQSNSPYQSAVRVVIPRPAEHPDSDSPGITPKPYSYTPPTPQSPAAKSGHSTPITRPLPTIMRKEIVSQAVNTGEGILSKKK